MNNKNKKRGYFKFLEEFSDLESASKINPGNNTNKVDNKYIRSIKRKSDT